MSQLKSISPEGVEAALSKAEQYRRLGESWFAESICLDILDVEPDHQAALVKLLLAITDQFKSDGSRRGDEAKALLDRMEGDYERAYYAGIIWERMGTAAIRGQTPGVGVVAYERLSQAMACFEEAEQVRPTGDDSAILRWNSCARLIQRYDHVRPAYDEPGERMLE